MPLHVRCLAPLLLACLVAAAEARAQGGPAADFFAPGPMEFDPIPTLTPYEAIRTVGPFLSDGRGLDLCELFEQLGNPSIAFTGQEEQDGPFVLRLSFTPIQDPVCSNPPPELFGAVRIFAPPQVPGDYEFRYQGGGLDVALPFTIADLDESPLAATAGRVTFDEEGDERADLAAEVRGGDLAWLRTDLIRTDVLAQFMGDPRPRILPQGSSASFSVTRVQATTNGRLVWDGVDANVSPQRADFDLFVFDRASRQTVNATDGVPPDDDERSDELPQTSGTRVVWQRAQILEDPAPGEVEDTLEIFLADLSAPLDAVQLVQLTDDDRPDRNPRIDGDIVVWQHLDGSADGDDSEIFYLDLAVPMPTPIRLTDDAGPDAPDDVNPRVSGTLVVWERRDPAADGNDLEIFVADVGAAPPVAMERVTRNDFEDRNPFLLGESLVWQAKRPDTVNPFVPIDDFEIQFASLAPPLSAVECGPPPFAGPDCVSVTDNDGDDVNARVRGTRVFWEGLGGSGALVQVLTVPDATSPATPERISQGTVSPGTLVIAESESDVPNAAWSEVVDDPPQPDPGGSDPAANFEIHTLPAIPTPEPGAVAARLAALLALAALAGARARPRAGAPK